jgi:diguanylate cyclase (GGDEF)-like protein/PAS domain S-box-containing protein
MTNAAEHVVSQAEGLGVRILLFGYFEAGIHEGLLTQLARSGIQPEWEAVGSAAEVALALDHGAWDALIVNGVHSAESASDMLGHFKSQGVALPVVVWVAADEEEAAAGHAAGANTVVDPDELQHLPETLKKEIAQSRESRGRRLAEDALRENETLLTALLDNVSDFVAVLDAAGVMRYISPAGRALVGYTADELLGSDLVEHVHTEDALPLIDVLAGLKHSPGPPGTVPLRLRRQDGTWLRVEAMVRRKHAHDARSGAILVARAVGERPEANDDLRRRAYLDPLTGLPNRALFDDRLAQALAAAQRGGHGMAVAFVDLDHFKQVNDSLGHVVGDALLRRVGERLNMVLREYDTVARWGGDEFVLILHDVTAEDAARIGHQLVDVFRQPLECAGHQLTITVSIGVSLYPSDGDSAAALIQNADAAVYRAKEQGRNGCRLFAPAMNARAFERLVLEKTLRDALRRQEFVAHYQPVLDLRSGQVTGVEVLVRWRHPDLGLVRPEKFMPVADEIGLTEPLGEWLLQTACRHARQWRQAEVPLRRICVNVTARQLRNRQFPDRVGAILKETGLDADGLQIELDEKDLPETEDTNGVLAALTRLREMGIHVALDHFGTGHCSFSRLKKLPVNALKIDASLLRELNTDAGGGEIVKLLLGLGQNLRLRMGAQGVETQRQLALLRDEGCDEIQGYLVSRAVAPADVPALFSRNLHTRPSAARPLKLRWRTAAYAAAGVLAAFTVLSSTWPRGTGPGERVGLQASGVSTAALPVASPPPAPSATPPVERAVAPSSAPLPSAPPRAATPTAPPATAAARPTPPPSTAVAVSASPAPTPAALATAAPRPPAPLTIVRALVTSRTVVLREDPAVNGTVDFEVRPAAVSPGQPYTVDVYVTNQGDKALRLAEVGTVQTSNGRRSGQTLPPRVAEVPPRVRLLVAQMTGAWAADQSEWRVAAFIVSSGGDTLRSEMSWR